MTQYTVQHTCGHAHNYNLCGEKSARDQKLAWLAQHECPACQKGRKFTVKDWGKKIDLFLMWGAELDQILGRD